MGLVSYTNIEDGQSADANVFNSRYGDILAQVNGNLDAQNIKNGSLTRELFAQDAISAAWPVGSVYISVENTNPASLLGGNWVRFGQGRALVGVNESDTDFDESEKTTGAKTVALTAAQNGPHTHSVNPPSTSTSSAGAHSHRMGRDVAYTDDSSRRTGPANPGQSYGAANFSTSSAGAHTHTVNIPTFNSASSGSGQAHNNVQPSIAVYLWKRVS